MLPDKNTKLTPECMNTMPYLRAAVKEGMRMYPAVLGNMRRTAEKLVIRGFQVPKDVDILFGLMNMSMDQKYFGSPGEFVPERWLKQEDEKVCPHSLKMTHPFSYLPFGFGSRFCAGKRIAEMEIEVFLTRFLRNYKIEWHHDDYKVKVALVNLPISPLKFRLTNV